MTDNERLIDSIMRHAEDFAESCVLAGYVSTKAETRTKLLELVQQALQEPIRNDDAMVRPGINDGQKNAFEEFSQSRINDPGTNARAFFDAGVQYAVKDDVNRKHALDAAMSTIYLGDNNMARATLIDVVKYLAPGEYQDLVAHGKA